ncbi:hypothetical protein RGR602_PC00106 (plasmid) [Rhizobium gallicum bv. gallicum R602sp]|uniref:Uncharacterized protein n=1 Tax=Rhizobium gallicum bv. gallicum R602sp TaxID=1041138 RepID=A0A0B4XC40_9HYPH|nr:hypothetical protein RGR602_PC00106 [Rhizobium gallicum bv. gallicum R602sp]
MAACTVTVLIGALPIFKERTRRCVFRSPMTLWAIFTAAGGYAFLVNMTEVGGTGSQFGAFLNLAVLRSA